jgi:hypothetical protein
MQFFFSIQPILYGKFCRKIGALINPAATAPGLSSSLEQVNSG